MVAILILIILIYGPMLLYGGAIVGVLSLLVLMSNMLTFVGLPPDSLMGLVVVFLALQAPISAYFVIRIWFPLIWIALVNLKEALLRNNGVPVTQAVRVLREHFGFLGQDWTRYRKFVRGRN
ncbi:hypothetical protein DL239_04635 [Sedimentitalea sp. CY04]|uniref:Uncharacterized protein n=1 Tax=Parasedimentitalea denitrificans TaxID=2211118 RepID=A0ABX0W4L3_9RHOB|nr:hypothetical protein [Sedimentitalea sp. CY04]